MVASERLICPSHELPECGQGIRFVVRCKAVGGVLQPAFVVRFAGQVHAYFNRCSHVPVELDHQPGEFFDDSKLYLICAMHGALFSPATGDCLLGRCAGKGLQPLPVLEENGGVYLQEHPDFELD